MTDYIEYDDYGIVEIRCMSCKIAVAGRTYIELPSRTEAGKKEKVLTMKRYSNWKQIKVDLSGGTFAEPICCVDCVKGDIDLAEIESQMKKGWKKELIFAGRDKTDLEKHDKKVKTIKIKRRVS
jgi:hypothetical protein